MVTTRCPTQKEKEEKSKGKTISFLKKKKIKKKEYSQSQQCRFILKSSLEDSQDASDPNRKCFFFLLWSDNQI